MSAIRLTTRLSDYGELMKPRITMLALVTTFSGSWLAAGGMPEFFQMMFTLLGTALGASSASVLNNFVDRDVDRHMTRTENRCLPDGRVHPLSALFFGLFLGGAGVTILAWKIGPLPAVILLFTISFYILVYTLWLKRCTPFATEIGGLAGSMPPVIGWTAVTGSLGWEAFALFAIMFIWQPPHFWTLGIHYLEDYKNANLPRFPVVRGTDETKRRILFYTLLLLPVSLSPFWLGSVGHMYLFSAPGLGVAYLLVTLQFVKNPISPESTMRLFSISNLYLLCLFVLMLISSSS